MAREVIWADAAQEDLEAAAAYIHVTRRFMRLLL